MKFTITNMTVENRHGMPVIDCRFPRFGWMIDAGGEGMLQKAYRITVNNGNETVWDSGTVCSDVHSEIVYAGKELEAETEYTWTAAVTDQEGETNTASAVFETAEKEVLADAEWIGSNELPLNTASLSVFRMSCTLTMKPESTEAGFAFGGDDERLMNADMNLQGLCAKPGESRMQVMLDVRTHPACVHVYRYGYDRSDSASPLYTLTVPKEIINEDNRYASHTIYLSSEYGQLDIGVDGEDAEHSLLAKPTGNPFADMGRRLNVNPMGRGGDYIAYPIVGKIGFMGDASFASLVIRNYREPRNVLYEGTPAVNVLQDVSHGANTMLVKSFDCTKKIVKAKVYATARGLYELYLNGQKVTEDVLTPGFSQYDQHHYYQVYDVSELMRDGENRIGAVLAEGWFSGAHSFVGANWNYYGDRSSFILKMKVTYEDDTQDVIVTDPSWLMNNDGPVRSASLFQGEDRDMRKEELLQDFTVPAYVLNWKQAEIVKADETTARTGDDEVGFAGALQKGLDYTRTSFRVQPDESVKVSAVLTAVSMHEPRSGVYIYDMGQNIAGVEEVTVCGHAGQRITMRFAEVLYPDLPEYKEQAGTLMLENIRAAMATDHFVLREGKQVLRPSFTWHGYRYIEITGIEEPLPLEAVKGLSYSSMYELSAEFSCSDPLINRLYQNICWSLQDNFISIPTDCPQRNERMGWSGDLSVFSRTASYMCDCEAFLHRHMQAVRDTQINGRFPDIAPVGGGFGGILWGSVGMTVPWEMYLHYGDVRILEEQYEAMKAYVSFMQSTLDEKGIVTNGPLGDWLGPQNTMNESAYLWQCYYIYDLEIMRKTAELLGHHEEAESYVKIRQEAVNAFLHVYIDQETGMTVFSDEEQAMGLNSPFDQGKKEKAPDQTASGRYIMDTQTSYAVPLALGILEGETKKKAEEYLNRACTRETFNDWKEVCAPYTLMTGFIGTAWISQALSDAGYNETAWRMLKETSYPSWLYPVTNGATTIWERLNSYTNEKGFGGNNSMNSFNHYSFGAVGTWMLAYAGGVRRSSVPGTFRIAPIPDPDGDVTWVKVKVRTKQGVYEVKWQREEDGIVYDVSIPAGRCTDVELPGDEAMAARIAAMKGIQRCRYENGRVCFTAMPGSYRF